MGSNKTGTLVPLTGTVSRFCLRGACGAIVELKFRILGPPELSSAGQERATISPQLWCVLVSLLMSPNTPTTTSTLIDRVWGEFPTGHASSTIRSYISRLNRLLHRALGGEADIEGRAHGYLLHADPQSVDLYRFRSLTRQADAVAKSGDREHAALLLREADALWRGPALGDLAGDWIARMRHGLEEERHAARLKRIALELHLGRHAELIGELTQLSAAYPLDEALTGLCMTALYRAGRQADALRHYRDTRDQLAEQGIEPGAELAGLHQRILRHDPDLANTPRRHHPGPARQPNTLPPGTDDFVGRTAEIQMLTAGEGAETPVLRIIDGMPGIGKTALAVQAARNLTGRYPDAQLYLNIHAHDPAHEPLTPAEALDRLLQMLAVPATRIPADLADRAKLWHAELARRRAMIVLDDATGPGQIRPLLPTSGRCLTIVTSRRRYPDWGAAQAHTLDILPEEEAVSLFTQIAGPLACRDPGQVARAVRLCGRLPLAIRVIASHLRHGRPGGLAGLLDELSDIEPRHGHNSDLSLPVTTAFELSYQRLSPGQQRLLRYLGSSPCPEVTLHAAVALSGGTLADTEAALGALLDHHLLEQPAPGRFQFHDLVHAYAADRAMRTDPETTRRQATGRLLDYYLRTVNRANQVLYPRQRPVPGSVSHAAGRAPILRTPELARQWLEAEWRNILRAAADAARHEWKRQCADLTHALAEFLDSTGNWNDAIDAHVLALQACLSLDDLPRTSRAALDLSIASLRTGRHGTALQHARQAADACRSLGDRQGLAAALDWMGVTHRRSGRFRDALAHHQEAMDIYMAAGDRHGLAEALVHAGNAYSSLGRYTEEIRHLSEALALYREVGDRRGEAKTLNNIGAANIDQGYHRDGLDSYQKALDIYQELGARYRIALLHHNIGRIQQYKGLNREALTAFREALAAYREMGDLQHQSYALCDIGSAYQYMECYSEALIHQEKARSVAEDIGDPHALVRALSGIADAHSGSGHHNAAREHYQQALHLAREIEAPYLEAKALDGLAETLFHMHRPEEARLCWRQALDLFQQLSVPEAQAVTIRLDALAALPT
jgi:DNA-binding SARP family transcriptional activator/tetratricopeptide (TPR) repeat protein